MLVLLLVEEVSTTPFLAVPVCPLGSWLPVWSVDDAEAPVVPEVTAAGLSRWLVDVGLPAPVE